MTGACPECGQAVELRESGRYACSRCRVAFDAFLAPARAPSLGPAAPPVVAAAAAPGDACCALHAGNRADGVCERCGNFMCALCTIPMEGRSYCPGCYELLRQRGSLGFVQRGFTTPSAALALSIISLPTLFLYCIGAVLAVASLIMGVKSLRQIAAQPDLPGRGKAIAAIAVSSVTLAITLGAFAWAGACLLQQGR